MAPLTPYVSGYAPRGAGERGSVSTLQASDDPGDFRDGMPFLGSRLWIDFVNSDSAAPKNAKVLSKPVHLRELVNEVHKMLAA